MMKYNVGDRVLIKSLDWYNENKDKNGFVNCREYDFVPQMSGFCGKILTIDIDFEDETYLMKEDTDGFVFTIEMIERLVERNEKIYRYKIGDRVILKNNKCATITDLKYNSFGNLSYYIKIDNDSDISVGIYDNMIEGLAKDEMPLDKAGQITDFEYEGLAYTLPDGYQFVDENGNEILTNKIILKKKKKDYPETYEECCEIIHSDPKFYVDTHLYSGTLGTLYKLLICRDAYWQIAGEEMGLGKPWEPDWRKEGYIIYRNQDDIISGYRPAGFVEHHIFEFPTKEMRDAFKENFNPDIEICKEFL